jgi:hypothetical protein
MTKEELQKEKRQLIKSFNKLDKRASGKIDDELKK